MSQEDSGSAKEVQLSGLLARYGDQSDLEHPELRAYEPLLDYIR